MRMATMTLVTCIFIISPSIGQAQTIENLYNAYNFRLPFLQGGEYITSLIYFDNRRDEDRFLADTLVVSSLQTTRVLRASGLVAITDRFLTEIGLEFWPEQSQFRSEGTRPGDNYESRIDAHVSPSVLLVYRFSRRLETSGSFQYERQTIQATDDLGFTPDLSKTDRYRIQLGITWFGKL